jgi:hypothetical protein
VLNNITLAATALTGSGAFSAIEWASDVVKEALSIADSVEDAVVGKVLDQAAEAIGDVAGAYMTDYDGGEEYELSKDGNFATKVASGFFFILVTAAGGTLSAATVGSGAFVTAIAVLVWIGDKEEAQQRKRWNGIVNNMIANLENLRQKKLQQIYDKYINGMERNVMSNA